MCVGKNEIYNMSTFVLHNSQPPVIPLPGLHGYPHSCVHTNTHIIKNKKNKLKNFEEIVLQCDQINKNTVNALKRRLCSSEHTTLL